MADNLTNEVYIRATEHAVCELNMPEAAARDFAQEMVRVYHRECCTSPGCYWCGNPRRWMYPVIAGLRWVLRGCLDYGLGLDVLVTGGDAWLDRIRAPRLRPSPVPAPLLPLGQRGLPSLAETDAITEDLRRQINQRRQVKALLARSNSPLAAPHILS